MKMMFHIWCFFRVLVIQFERQVQRHVIHIADKMLLNYISKEEHEEGDRKAAEDWAFKNLTGNTF